MYSSTSKIWRTTVFVACMAVFVAACGNGASPDGGEEEPIVLNWATTVAPGSLQASGDVQHWADEVAERTDGRIQVNIHHADSLVTTGEMLDAMQSGVADGASLIAAVHPDQFSTWIEFGTVHDLDRTLRWTPEQQVELTNRMVEEYPIMNEQIENAGVKLMWSHATPPYAIMSSEPIRTLDDLSGKRIRTFGTGIPKMFEAGGAVPVDLPFGEIYSATQTGVVDGAFTSLDGMASLSYFEVAPYITLLGERGSTSLMSFGLLALLSQRTWDRLSAEDQEILLDAGQNASLWYAQESLENHAEVLDRWVAEGGGEIFRLSEEETEQWRSQLGDPYQATAEILNEQGLPGDAFRDSILEIADELME